MDGKGAQKRITGLERQTGKISEARGRKGHQSPTSRMNWTGKFPFWLAIKLGGEGEGIESSPTGKSCEIKEATLALNPKIRKIAMANEKGESGQTLVAENQSLKPVKRGHILPKPRERKAKKIRQDLPS